MSLHSKLRLSFQANRWHHHTTKPRLYRYSAKFPEVAAAIAWERFSQSSACRMAVGFRFLITSQTELSTKCYARTDSMTLDKVEPHGAHLRKKTSLPKPKTVQLRVLDMCFDSFHCTADAGNLGQTHANWRYMLYCIKCLHL